MERKKLRKEWVSGQKYADDPLEEGFRILARIILRRMRTDRAAGKFPKEIKKNDDVVLNYEI